ncbi:MAG: hypothetical protein E6I97_23505 [Chloroflexi bacterium]|nr:MAG: hypothetical protein E6I97_23505 [Chloroflexota bacterium]
MVFALMGFPDESAPPPSHVASSLQISRSKLRHAHKGDTPLFHHVDHHALESAMSRVLGRWYSYPGQLMINGMQQDHSWASGFAALPHHLRGHPSQVRAGPDRREERNHGRPCGRRGWASQHLRLRGAHQAGDAGEPDRSGVPATGGLRFR